MTNEDRVRIYTLLGAIMLGLSWVMYETGVLTFVRIAFGAVGAFTIGGAVGGLFNQKEP